MQVVVDHQRCEGHGMCADAAPEVFTLDEEGVVVLLVDPVRAEQQATTERAVRLCPVAALRVQP